MVQVACGVQVTPVDGMFLGLDLLNYLIPMKINCLSCK